MPSRGEVGGLGEESASPGPRTTSSERWGERGPPDDASTDHDPTIWEVGTGTSGDEGRMGRGWRHRLVSPSVKRPYRVVVAKPGLDGHDRGAKVIARALRDAGFEVIYTGLHQTAEQVVQAVVEEDADAVGLSLLSGAHLTLVPRIVEGLGEKGRGDVLVLVGGIIPADDIPVLKGMGVARCSPRGHRSRPSAPG